MIEPKILVLAEPACGVEVEVGVRREIYRPINGLKTRGLTTLLISSDLPELLGIAHRILFSVGSAVLALSTATR